MVLEHKHAAMYFRYLSLISFISVYLFCAFTYKAYNIAYMFEIFHPQSNASLTKLPTNCLNVFGHFVGVALKGLNAYDNFHFTKFEF